MPRDVVPDRFAIEAKNGAVKFAILQRQVAPPPHLMNPVQLVPVLNPRYNVMMPFAAW